MLGIEAYPPYTLDKLVAAAVPSCSTSPPSPGVRCAELAARAACAPARLRAPRRPLLRRDHTAFLVKLYGGDAGRVSFELLPGERRAASRAGATEDAGAEETRLLLRNARARAPGYTHNAHSQPAAAGPAAGAHRRKAVAGAARRCGFRPLQLYARVARWPPPRVARPPARAEARRLPRLARHAAHPRRHVSSAASTTQHTYLFIFI
uniref:Uncharacterized protein n=1 Tax=Heliothis virescens TaxID=7102 RepID=A0A2A4JMF8_HELVI